MSSGCRCAGARAPVRATYVNLYRWPESDVAFVRSVVTGGRGGGYRAGIRCGSRRRWVPGRAAVVDSYSCRQMYLRSYTFTKKESVNERTMRCIGKVRQLAAIFSGFSRSRKENSHRRHHHHHHQKQYKKGCVVATKLSETSLSAISSFFRRLLYSTSNLVSKPLTSCS